MKKRILSLIMILVLISAFFPAIAVQASESVNIGDYIQMGTYYGEPILWRCVDIDENGPLILSDKIICIKPFDAETSVNDKTGSHSRSGRGAYGSNYWKDSNMRSWLNSAADAGDVIWLCGNPPKEEYVWNGYNEYDQEAGFLTNFTQNEKNSIKTVTQKTIVAYPEIENNIYDFDSEAYEWNNIFISDIIGNYSKAYSQNVSDKVFLLDVKQLYNVYINSSILGNKYYVGQATEKALVYNDAYSDENELTTYDISYLLRTPDTSSNGDIRCVSADGNIYNAHAVDDYSFGVRPAFYLDENAIFNYGEGTESNPYSIEKVNKANIPSDALYYEGHYYKVFNVSMTWPDAKEYCKSIGGHLITITSPKEQLIAEKLLDNSSPNKYQYWIGLDLNYNSWVTGELVKYSNWDEIEPNYHTRDDGEVEHYVHMLNMENPNVPGNKRFAWNDMFYDNTFPGEEGFFSLDNVGFICEWDSGECDDMPTPTPTLDFEMQSNYCPINDHAVMFGEIVDNNCDGRIEDIVKNITWTIDDNSVAEILETSHICSVDGNSALIDLTIIGHKAGKTTVTGIAPNGMKTDATIYVEPEMEDIEYSQTNEPTTLVYGVDLGYSDADYLDDFLKNLKCMVSTENNNMTITGTRYSISDDGALGFYYVDTEPSIIYGRGDEDAEIEITSEGGQTAKIKTCVKRVIPSYYDTYKPSTWDEVENAANEFIASTDDYMNSVLNVMQSGDDEALQKEALRRKCALEMLEKDNASYSKILTFGSINDDNIKLNAYEALYDALEKARENAGVNLGDIKFSGDLIKNNTAIVKKITEALSSVKVNDNYGGYDINLTMNSFGLGGVSAKYGSMIIRKNGRQLDTVAICSTQEEAEAAMSMYFEQLKDLAQNSVAAAASEVVKALSGKKIDEWGKWGIKNLIKKYAPTVQIKGAGDLSDSITRCADLYKSIKKITSVRNKSTEKKIDAALNIYTSTLRDNLSDKSITDAVVKSAYDNMSKKLNTLSSHAFSYSKDTEVEKEQGWNWFASFKCPVNVYVYDKRGRLAGSAENNRVEYSDDIMIEKSGDIKKVYLPSLSDYDIRLVATDTGKLNCTVEQYSEGEPIGRANFYDIDLYENKELVCSGDIDNIADSYYDLSITSDDDMIAPDEYFNSYDDASADISVVSSEGGSVLGAGRYAKGDGVNLTAMAEDNYSFKGWYKDGELVSSDATYSLCAVGDMLLTAEFEPDYEAGITNISQSADGSVISSEIKNNTEYNLSANAYTAIYDGSGKLCGVSADNHITVNANDGASINAAVGCGLESGYRIKLFLWDDNMSPVIDCKEITL